MLIFQIHTIFEMLNLIIHPNPISTFQKELAMVVDTTHQLYYADVVDPTLRDLNQLETLSNKVVDIVTRSI
jgi:hypothetical protein